MKIIPINKVIKEISNSKFSNFTLTLEESSINYGLEIAMQIIKDNIKEKKIDYAVEWYTRYNDLLNKYTKLLSRYIKEHDLSVNKPRDRFNNDT